MRKIVLIGCLVGLSLGGFAQYGVLNESELNDFKVLAEKRAQQFGLYVAKIANKSTNYLDKETAISQALNLFINDTVTIQISYCGSKWGNKVYSKKLVDYLRRLSLLNYDQVTIEWVECAMVKELRKGEDGNYYGNISFVQRFKGTRGEQEYSDITTKSIEVVLKPYQKPNDRGENEWRWEVFLSNVNVKEPCS